MTERNAGARASIVPLDALPHTRHSHEFVGADHGEVPFSIILVHSRPGAGPAIHTHPYAEVFVVDSGQATFVLGDETVVVEAGGELFDGHSIDEPVQGGDHGWAFASGMVGGAVQRVG